jgi:hypothetical protein
MQTELEDWLSQKMPRRRASLCAGELALAIADASLIQPDMRPIALWQVCRDQFVTLWHYHGTHEPPLELEALIEALGQYELINNELCGDMLVITNATIEA